MARQASAANSPCPTARAAGAGVGFPFQLFRTFRQPAFPQQQRQPGDALGQPQAKIEINTPIHRHHVAPTGGTGHRTGGQITQHHHQRRQAGQAPALPGEADAHGQPNQVGQQQQPPTQRQLAQPVCRPIRTRLLQGVNQVVVTQRGWQNQRHSHQIMEEVRRNELHRTENLA